jgi:hypothetical protein
MSVPVRRGLLTFGVVVASSGVAVAAGRVRGSWSVAWVWFGGGVLVWAVSAVLLDSRWAVSSAGSGSGSVAGVGPPPMAGDRNVNVGGDSHAPIVTGDYNQGWDRR